MAGKLHIFDMDGTLLSGSACLELSRHVGQLAPVLEAEERWGRGEIGHVAFYELLLPLWEGLKVGDVDEVFHGCQWLEGIEDVWADIARRGEYSAVITLSPQFFVERLLPWGLGSAHGAGVNVGAALDPASVLTPEGKVDVATDLMRRHGVGPDDCIAYGDSASDVPLFEHLRHTVAINASASLREVAAVSYDGPDLRAAYEVGRALIEGGQFSTTAGR